MRVVTNEMFLKRVRELRGSEYTFLEQYKGNMVDIKVRHNICGFEYKVSPNRFLGKKQVCSHCYGHIHRRTPEYFKQEIFNLVGEEYSLVGEYINQTTKVTMKHNTCGNIYKVKPYSFLAGHKCPKCMGKLRGIKSSKSKIKNENTYKQELLDISGGRLTLVGKYLGSTIPTEHKCNSCNNTMLVRPSDILSHGFYCSYCKGSTGEKMIQSYLKKHNISYSYPKTFSDLVDKAPLHYDFYLPKYNVLIEYQGEQHFKPISYMGGEKSFEVRQKHDKMKRDYANAKGYTEIEINATQINTQSKMDSFLDKILL